MATVTKEQIEQFQIKPFEGMDVGDIQERLAKIDTFGVLNDLGFNLEESKEILNGNTEVVMDRVFNRLMILDFDAIMFHHGQKLNRSLCEQFMLHAKNGEDFTDEQVTAYGPIFAKFFKMCFEVGEDFTFVYEDVDKDVKNLIMQWGSDYYQLSLSPHDAMITYLPEFDPSKI
jgi:hypothetical protein